MEFEPVIGLEIHVELSTKSKMFCGCRVEFGGEPNTRTCPVCLAHPGALPVMNQQAIRYLARISLSLECSVPEKSIFHRKNYFYPDLPKGYQISQYDQPFAVDGQLHVMLDEKDYRVGIERVHQEEDTAKNIHGGESGRIAGSTYSLIDFNRSGTPLVEIVTRPDIHSPQVARAFLNKLKNTLQYLDVSDCNMEEGSLRCDANISMRPVGDTGLGVKTELKNMNSFKHLEKGLTQEIIRQTELLKNGEKIVQQTVHFDVTTGDISPLRSKEFAHDYRYFPEPDLVPLIATAKFVDGIRAEMPELPEARAQRYMKDLELPEYNAEVLTASRELADFFESVTEKTSASPKSVSNWAMGDLSGYLNSTGEHLATKSVFPEGSNICKLSPENFGNFVKMVDEGIIGVTSGKEVLPEMCKTGKSANKIVKAKGLTQISDQSELEAHIDEAIAGNPGQVEQYRAGKEQVIGFFVGQVMKATRGQANPKLVNELLKKKLSG
ncbi:MAG: Asp-tRNA(Asn)/Glu-tRNA(Gln) amidotransferase subunit GatB [Thermoleophilia bacterium]|nr:Asp-tRNA(Asn)/Glu-tRNA(Gln) amidotransferase subunit GatB [Thermoleophilia bacterium]